MSDHGYLVIITATYSDDSSLELKRYECEDYIQLKSRIIEEQTHYSMAMSNNVYREDGISICMRVFKINKYGIPKLVAHKECNEYGLCNGREL